MAGVVAAPARQENLLTHWALIDETKAMFDTACDKGMAPRLVVRFPSGQTVRADGCTVMPFKPPAP